ncbi:hypothetical protein Vadar_014356 [Vaccinium darrowii]|uniref:Uncharacterized protein n=1 Tax=Vaccinium darrowii TaxID=229202 RepID=A0ACB7XAQ5_9ERIC|nr:hypothetical protein Vadar_014356 [Vaccinium darrowii]
MLLAESLVQFFPRIPFAMTDKDQVLGIETIALLLEQLGKAFLELEAHNDAAEDNVQWSEIEHYFQHLETTMKKKFEELELKEESTIGKLPKIEHYQPRAVETLRLSILMTILQSDSKKASDPDSNPLPFLITSLMPCAVSKLL